jgi:hypothetical protein
MFVIACYRLQRVPISFAGSLSCKEEQKLPSYNGINQDQDLPRHALGEDITVKKLSK